MKNVFNFEVLKLPPWLPGLVLFLSSPAFSLFGEIDPRRDYVVEAIEKALPSVVNIATETIIKARDPWDQLFREFWDPYHSRQNNFSLGSGVVIDEDGYLVTNHHVVRRADRIWVRFANNTNAIYEAKLVAFHNQSDLALLKIETTTTEKFKAVKFAADDDLLLGETVIALGNPFGLGGSVSRGILSSKSRLAPKESQHLDIPNLLQTDASINPGNSGGPLVNVRGELIGINVAILREAQGIGFAIPIRRVTEAISEIFTPENLRSLWFGARLRPAKTGFYVTALEPQSPAEKAGLKIGDLILQVNGKSQRNLIEINESLMAGKEVRIEFLRNQERKTVPIRLVAEKEFFNNNLIQQKLGLTFQEINQLAQGTEGMVVASVEKNSPASDSKLQRGLLVTAIDGVPISTVVEAAKLIRARKKGDPVVLDVIAQRRFGNFIQDVNAQVVLNAR
jgi:S1-C subfamily serine protease